MWKFIKTCFKIYIWFIITIFTIIAVMLMQTDEIQQKTKEKMQGYDYLNQIKQIQDNEKEILEQNKKALEILKNSQ